MLFPDTIKSSLFQNTTLAPRPRAMLTSENSEVKYNFQVYCTLQLFEPLKRSDEALLKSANSVFIFQPQFIVHLGIVTLFTQKLFLSLYTCRLKCPLLSNFKYTSISLLFIQSARRSISISMERKNQLENLNTRGQETGCELCS